MTIDYDRYDRIRAVQWRGDHLRLLDQRLLPREERWIDCRDAAEVTQAIRDLAVRGAPAIGIAAAWGVALAARQAGKIAEIEGVSDMGFLPIKIPPGLKIAIQVTRGRQVIESPVEATELLLQVRRAAEWFASRRPESAGDCS